jgi:hypothetical protein
MDFERLKQNLRFRSGRTSTNMSKRFPTREPERDHDRMEPPETLQLNPNPRRKAKVFTKAPPTQNTGPSNPQFDAKTGTDFPPSHKPATVPENGRVKSEGDDPLARKHLDLILERLAMICDPHIQPSSTGHHHHWKTFPNFSSVKAT